MDVTEHLQLMDWRRRIAEAYAAARSTSDPVAAWHGWRKTRDELFKTHPQSPLPEGDRQRLDGLSYFEYDPAARTVATLEAAPPERFEIGTSGEAPMVFERIATARFRLGGHDLSVDAYWLDVYGGGLFVPFRDATSGAETYGAGRYLIDSIKGADLGVDGDRVVFDFNFAFNPSCSYDARWVCPLAPPANHLAVAIRAGERN